MANPTPAAIASIQARVTALSLDWATETDAQVLAALQADTIANPTPQPTIPKPFVANDLALACSSANRPNLGSFLAGAAAALIVAQDTPHLSAGLDALATIGAISATDATAMKAVLTATTPDPAWPATLPNIQVTLGRAVDLDDITASRPAT